MSNYAWKYIIVATNDGLEFPIIFPAQIAHNEMFGGTVRAMMGSDRCPLPERKAVSAGFIAALRIGICEGRSESLNVDSRRDDHLRIDNFSFNRGKTFADAVFNSSDLDIPETHARLPETPRRNIKINFKAMNWKQMVNFAAENGVSFKSDPFDRTPKYEQLRKLLESKFF